MVTGTGERFAGGVTAAAGTAKHAVTDPRAAGGGAERPTPTVAAPSTPSRARPAGAVRRDWSCGWPEEEGDTSAHEARVRLRVRVDGAGRPGEVEVLASPSEPFAAAARRCVAAERFRPALDDAGERIEAFTQPFIVEFVR